MELANHLRCLGSNNDDMVLFQDFGHDKSPLGPGWVAGAPQFSQQRDHIDTASHGFQETPLTLPLARPFRSRSGDDKNGPIFYY